MYFVRYNFVTIYKSLLKHKHKSFYLDVTLKYQLSS
jgi:hypothetical protein